jgi:hypothetical protein
MKRSSVVLTLSLGLLLSSCASLQSTSLSSIPAKRDNVVRAEAGRTIILGFNFDNDYVNTLEADLKKQCPNGDVRGILTKDEAIYYFLFFVWKRKVTASGYCVGAGKS